MGGNFNAILQDLVTYEARSTELLEVILANLVLIAEIPAPTFDESRRAQFVLERFSEYQLQNISTDEAGNALGILPGASSEQNILVVSHLDTAFDASVDHTVTIEANSVVGPGVGDNSLGVAVVSTLPLILEQLGIRLRSNLILMGSSRSLGKGNIEGMRFFLSNTDLPVTAGISVEGVQLGMLSYSAIGMVRGEITYRVPEEYDWTRFGASGAIVNINDVINRILEIPLPRRPRTTIVLNSIEAGASFNTIPTQAVLQFEIRSESPALVDQLESRMVDITAEVTSRTGAEVAMNIFARQKPGGIDFSHPLATSARSILKHISIPARISPSTGELSAFVDRKIPAVSIGITDGEHLSEENESIEIQQIARGIAQLIALLVAIDEGHCESDPRSAKTAEARS